MFGVILWSNAADRKAVIWCEDQGDLAYYDDSKGGLAQSNDFLTAGDYVEFDVSAENSMRLARRVVQIEAAGRGAHQSAVFEFVSTQGAHQPQHANRDIPATVVMLSDHLPAQRDDGVQVSHHG